MTALAGLPALMVCTQAPCVAYGTRVDVEQAAVAFAALEGQRVHCALCRQPLAVLPLRRQG